VENKAVFPIKGSQCAARNPSADDGMTINFSPFSLATRPLEHDARNQARKNGRHQNVK